MLLSLSKPAVIGPAAQLPSLAASAELTLPIAPARPAKRAREDSSKIAENEESIQTIEGDNLDEEDTRPQKKKRSVPREKKYKCTYEQCTKAFARPCQLEQHNRSHTGERPFVCTEPDCGQAFFREYHLKVHIAGKHAEEKPLLCKYDGCGKRFASGHHLKRHEATHNGVGLKCDHGCDERFRKRSQLERHMREVHMGLLPFVCKREGDDGQPCGQDFATKGKLATHIQRIHTGVGNRYFCDLCQIDEETGQVVGGIKHVLTDEDWEDEVKREEDDSNWDPDADFHPEEQAGNREDVDFPADDYTSFTTKGSTALTSILSFPTWSALQKHIRSAHPPQCQHCQKICKTEKELRAHITSKHMSVDDRRSHVCTWEGCTASFTKASNLKTHVRTVHENDRRFPCDFCSDVFGHKAVLQRHIKRVHAGERRQKKHAGGKKLTKEMDLVDKLTGAGYEEGRNIVCVVEECEYRFAREKDLERHMLAEHGVGLDGEEASVPGRA